jgi:Domain of unknown function (DUF4168)
MSLKSNTLAIALAAASWCVAPHALSQEPQQPGPPPDAPAATAPPTAVTPIEDKKIEQFADAYLAVQSIQQKAASQLQTTTDAAQADQVKAEAEDQMIAAVEKTGLKVEEFNQIAQTMAQDTETRSRVAAKLQERTAQPD